MVTYPEFGVRRGHLQEGTAVALAASDRGVNTCRGQRLRKTQRRASEGHRQAACQFQRGWVILSQRPSNQDPHIEVEEVYMKRRGGKRTLLHRPSPGDRRRGPASSGLPPAHRGPTRSVGPSRLLHSGPFAPLVFSSTRGEKKEPVLSGRGSDTRTGFYSCARWTIRHARWEEDPLAPAPPNTPPPVSRRTVAQILVPLLSLWYHRGVGGASL